MAAKKREIYARAAVQLRTHERAIRAERACPGAMGLYLFLLLDSRGEETAGDVSELVAMCSWGAPEAYRKKQAEALIAVGLIERREDRLVVVKYDEHNDTPTDIETAREAARQRKQSQRSHAGQLRDSQVCPTEVPISISSSLSGSGSREGDARGSDSPPADTGPPELFGSAIATVEQETGETLRRADSWLRYQGHRSVKGVPMNRQDAVYWLTTVMVPEARKERRDEADKRDREAKWDRQRAGPLPPTEPRTYTEAEQRELAERFPMRRRTKGAA